MSADTSRYPSNVEVRRWAQALPKGHLVPNKGKLPKFVIVAWDRAHPDRRYVAAEAYHGTEGGYNNRSCRCGRCCEAKYAAVEAARRQRDQEAAEDLADDLWPGGAA